MTVSTAQRDRLNQIKERAKNARTARQAAQRAIDGAKQAGDHQAQLAAEVAFQQAVGELDLAQELESVVLSQMSGLSFAGMHGGESFFDDPDTLRSLEQLAHSSMPIGNAQPRPDDRP